MKLFGITRAKRATDYYDHVAVLLGTDLKLEFNQAVEVTLATNQPLGGFFVRPVFPEGFLTAEWGEDFTIHFGPDEVGDFGALGLPEVVVRSFDKVMRHQNAIPIEWAVGRETVVIHFKHIVIGIESDGYAHS